ncbi:hypothetical protein [uncultured Amnibacterium sp.]|uniref:hypothetical protein n=1 Tax=uncultured Amnibacterium sp. TaxID=1631851 RepID=UPI0035CB3E15
MTSWQDQQMRGGAGGAAVDPVSGAPMSRREAREAERRAAEALAEKQPHPSGVVDFQARDYGADFAPDQDFNVGDTQDIWKALTGERRPGSGPSNEQAAFRTAVPGAPAATPRGDAGSVNGELLDRVRDAVLRRAPEPQAPAAYEPPAAYQQPQAPARQQPQQRPAAFPQQPAAYDDGGLSRRARRERETTDLREDGLPSQLFADPGRPAPRAAPQPPVVPAPREATRFGFEDRTQQAGPPVEHQRQPAGFEGYDYEDDGYYDEPYAPEPTIAIPLQATDPVPATSLTNPVGLPHAFSEPSGDDALTFSSPIPSVPADHRDDWSDASVDPAFIEPEDRYGAQPRSAFSSPVPAQAPMPFVEPHAGAGFQAAQFEAGQLGPQSEVTDLAGFEALIRKARQQPAEPQAAQRQQAPGMAWADEEDVQDGFTGLLSRSVQGSHGSTNALIIPNDGSPDLTQALDSHGDIFITGSMNLSRSLSTTGAPSDLYDSQEIDRLYEAAQDEPASGVAPVRASKAVSGAPHDRRFAGPPSRRGNVLPTVLAIVAGAMAVGVVTLLVGSWVLKLF